MQSQHTLDVPFDQTKSWSGKCVPYVYFVTGADLVKIGYVNATHCGGLASRLTTLRTGSPVPLTLVRCISVGRPSLLEHMLHGYFAEHRRHGEWFCGSIMATINRLGDRDLLDLVGWPRPPA